MRGLWLVSLSRKVPRTSGLSEPLFSEFLSCLRTGADTRVSEAREARCVALRSLAMHFAEAEVPALDAGHGEHREHGEHDEGHGMEAEAGRREGCRRVLPTPFSRGGDSPMYLCSILLDVQRSLVASCKLRSGNLENLVLTSVCLKGIR